MKSLIQRPLLGLLLCILSASPTISKDTVIIAFRGPRDLYMKQMFVDLSPRTCCKLIPTISESDAPSQVMQLRPETIQFITTPRMHQGVAIYSNPYCEGKPDKAVRVIPEYEMDYLLPRTTGALSIWVDYSRGQEPTRQVFPHEIWYRDAWYWPYFTRSLTYSKVTSVGDGPETIYGFVPYPSKLDLGSGMSIGNASRNGSHFANNRNVSVS